MVVACGLAGMCSVLLNSRGEVVPTMNTDWNNATKEYMKFQKMNPIFGKTYIMTVNIVFICLPPDLISNDELIDNKLLVK